MLTSLRRTSLSTTPIVDTATVIQHTVMDNTADTNLLELYIASATNRIESYLDRSIRDQTLVYSVAHTSPPQGHESQSYGFMPFVIPLGLQWAAMHHGHQAIELPRAPTATLTSVELTSWRGTQTALTLNTDFEQNLLTEPARIRLIGCNRQEQHDTVTVTYTAGYVASGQTIPEDMQIAIMLQAAHMYRFRGDDQDAGGSLTKQARALLAPYRLQSFGA